MCPRSEGAEKVVDATLQAFGAIDILVNNVGTAKGTDIVDTADAEWQEAFDQTLYPAIRMSRLVVPHMRKHGGGSIVMIASIWGRESGGRMTYNAVKAAEISLAKSMAQQLAKDGIRVNSVAPGSILFPGGSWDKRQQADPAGIADFIRRELPFGRFGRAGRSRRGGGVSGFAARELDQRLMRACRWLSVALADLNDRFLRGAAAARAGLNAVGLTELSPAEALPGEIVRAAWVGFLVGTRLIEMPSALSCSTWSSSGVSTWTNMPLRRDRGSPSSIFFVPFR